ncbi:MAG: SIR2 family NAD-dependent protein deacylase [Candidatus Thorarchaeota archaeon]
MAETNNIARAKELIEDAKKITALTGAGISVDSGIPDFRSEGGIWTRYDPLEHATHDSFMKNPLKFWTMGRELAEVILKAKPNDAHTVLATLEKQNKLLGIITQNIDNLHQTAGNKRVIEIRGNYLKANCIECERVYFGDEVHQRVVEGEIPPICEECGGVLKSEAVLFGEPLIKSAMTKAIEISKETDLMLVIGTSLQIYPAAYLPRLAKKSGAKIILITLEGVNKTDVADVVLRGRASEIMPQIV